MILRPLLTLLGKTVVCVVLVMPLFMLLLSLVVMLRSNANSIFLKKLF